MRRAAKISTARLPLRKTVAVATAVRRAFPAWIDSDQGPAFSALVFSQVGVTARIRDSLVLRSVTTARIKRVRSSSDVSGGR